MVLLFPTFGYPTKPTVVSPPSEVGEGEGPGERVKGRGRLSLSDLGQERGPETAATVPPERGSRGTHPAPSLHFQFHFQRLMRGVCYQRPLLHHLLLPEETTRKQLQSLSRRNTATMTTCQHTTHTHRAPGDRLLIHTHLCCHGNRSALLTSRRFTFSAQTSFTYCSCREQILSKKKEEKSC